MFGGSFIGSCKQFTVHGGSFIGDRALDTSKCQCCRSPPMKPYDVFVNSKIKHLFTPNTGRNRFGSIRFGSGLFENSSVRFGSIRFGSEKIIFPIWRGSACVFRTRRGSVRFGSVPRPVPAGSRSNQTVRFGSVPFGRFGSVSYSFRVVGVENTENMLFVSVFVGDDVARRKRYENVATKHT